MAKMISKFQLDEINHRIKGYKTDYKPIKILHSERGLKNNVAPFKKLATHFRDKKRAESSIKSSTSRYKHSDKYETALNFLKQAKRRASNDLGDQFSRKNITLESNIFKKHFPGTNTIREHLRRKISPRSRVTPLVNHIFLN